MTSSGLKHTGIVEFLGSLAPKPSQHAKKSGEIVEQKVRCRSCVVAQPPTNADISQLKKRLIAWSQGREVSIIPYQSEFMVSEPCTVYGLSLNGIMNYATFDLNTAEKQNIALQPDERTKAVVTQQQVLIVYHPAAGVVALEKIVEDLISRISTFH